jgi:hypothetical protein
MKSPLSEVKERFGDKAKLVTAVEALAKGDLWLDRVSEQKSLAHVSNQKLLKLHDTLTHAKKEFGTRAKLISAVLEASKRSKDVGLKQRLERYPLPRLLDAHRSATRRAKAAKAALKKSS